MLHRNGAEHFHNQAVVCCSLLIVSPRSIEIAKALTLTTLNHLLATELKTEPLGSIADSNITELVMHYPLIDELGPYELYTVVRLVDLCVLRAYTEDNLNLVIRFYGYFISFSCLMIADNFCLTLWWLI